jgi:ribonucleotide monophosphatase NagD (HAD superfamily)
MEAFDFPPGFAAEANNLAIDFDGVIHNADKGFFDGTCYGDPIEGSLSALQELSTKYRIVIFTAKAKPNRPLIDDKTGTELVSEWLEKYGVLRYIAEITSEKPRAMLYIDDNAYRFENWQDTLAFIEKL